MKSQIKKYSAVCAALIIAITCFGQARIYTKKARMADIPVKTAKVVLRDNDTLSAALREAAKLTWRVSAYEFCTLQEYESLKTSSNFYFLHLEEEDGVPAIVFSKGGLQKTVDSFNEAFDIVSIPASDDGKYMDAMLDIIQNFVEDAMDSDRVGYLGLQYYNRNVAILNKLKRTDPSRVIRIRVGGSRIVFDRETHTLLSFHR